jgi:hypothetical protein
MTHSPRAGSEKVLIYSPYLTTATMSKSEGAVPQVNAPSNVQKLKTLFNQNYFTEIKLY